MEVAKMIQTRYITKIDKTFLPVAIIGSTKNTFEFLGNSSGNLKKDVLKLLL